MNITKAYASHWIENYKEDFERSLKHSLKYDSYREYTTQLAVFFHLDLISKKEWKQLHTEAFNLYNLAEYGKPTAQIQEEIEERKKAGA